MKKKSASNSCPTTPAHPIPPQCGGGNYYLIWNTMIATKKVKNDN